MAIRHSRRQTRTELERVFCRWIRFRYVQKYFFWPYYGCDAAVAAARQRRRRCRVESSEVNTRRACLVLGWVTVLSK